MFEWAHLEYLWLLPLPVLIMLLPRRVAKKSALYYPQLDLLAQATKRKKKSSIATDSKSWWYYLVLSLVWGLLIGALAGPQRVGTPEKVIKSARDFMVLADISVSMEVKDWQDSVQTITRWNGVRTLLKKFIADREGDRMGLIFFGGKAYLQCPFTNDLEMVSQLLDDTEVGMAGNKTAIGNAIARGLAVFEKDSSKQRVMLLLTDGQDSGSEVRPLQAAALAHEAGVKIYTLGIGDPEASVYDLDEAGLKAIATQTGGKYFRAENAEQLQAVYQEIDQLEPIEYEDDAYIPKEALYYYPLGAALLFALLGLLLEGIFQHLKSN